MAICPLHVSVCMFQERDIFEVIWVGKEGLTDKIQWETGTQHLPMQQLRLCSILPFFWPSSPRTFPWNEMGCRLRCRVLLGEQWEGLQVLVAFYKSQLCSKYHRVFASPFISKALY